jgi:cytoskeletal protein CcmA (bactofilin family)
MEDSMHKAVSEDVVTTLIAAHTTIKGEVIFTGPAQVVGTIEGQIKAEDTLEICAGGTVRGDIHGTRVEIHGTVRGNVNAPAACVLGPTAKLIGELHSSNLSLSDGAIFVGKVFVGDTASVDDTAEAADGQATASRRIQVSPDLASSLNGSSRLVKAGR